MYLLLASAVVFFVQPGELDFVMTHLYWLQIFFSFLCMWFVVGDDLNSICLLVGLIQLLHLYKFITEKYDQTRP